MIGTIVLAFNSFRFTAVIGIVAALSVGAALLAIWAPVTRWASWRCSAASG